MRHEDFPANDFAGAWPAGSAPLAPAIHAMMAVWGASCAAGLEATLWPLEFWSRTLGALAGPASKLAPETPSLACALADVAETRDAVLATRDEYLRALSR